MNKPYALMIGTKRAMTQKGKERRNSQRLLQLNEPTTPVKWVQRKNNKCLQITEHS